MISVNNNFGKNKAQFKPKTMEKENLKKRGWLKKFLHWISKGAVKSVNASGSCPT